jgi:hypothetical protein
VEGGVAPRIGAPAPSRLMEMLNTLLTPRFLAPSAAFLLILSALSWLLVERARLNEELGKAQARISDQQRLEREIADQLAAQREQSGKLKSELDRALEALAQRPSLPTPSIVSFLLKPMLSPRGDSETQLKIMIPHKTDLVRLQMKIEKGDYPRFQATVRKVGGPQVWNQRLLKPRSGVITVNVPADKLPVEDYILTLSATTPAGETEVINRYSFRILRK